jgi:hypothetical protein
LKVAWARPATHQGPGKDAGTLEGGGRVVAGLDQIIDDPEAFGAVLKEKVEEAAVGFKAIEVLAVHRVFKGEVATVLTLALIVAGIVLLPVGLRAEGSGDDVGVGIVVGHGGGKVKIKGEVEVEELEEATTEEEGEIEEVFKLKAGLHVGTDLRFIKIVVDTVSVIKFQSTQYGFNPIFRVIDSYITDRFFPVGRHHRYIQIISALGCADESPVGASLSRPGFGILVYNCIGRQHPGQVVQVGDEYGLQNGNVHGEGLRKVSRRVTQMDAQIPQRDAQIFAEILDMNLCSKKLNKSPLLSKEGCVLA